MDVPQICVLCERYKPREGRADQPSVTMSTAGGLDFCWVHCPRCGAYKVARRAVLSNAEGFDEELGLKLSRLVRISTDAEERPPVFISQENANTLAAPVVALRNYADRVECLLVDLAKICRYPGRSSGRISLERLAALACLPLDACAAVLTQMRDDGLLAFAATDPVRFETTVRAAGWTRIDALQASRPHSDRAFVAMWFDETMTAAYSSGIEPALRESGYVGPFRVDDPKHDARADDEDFEPKIDDRIIAEIRRARFLIADVTGARPAVYFEAGFAQGLNTPIIWTCRRDRAHADMCFDTRQIGHIIWGDPDDLRERLVASIAARGWARIV